MSIVPSLPPSVRLHPDGDLSQEEALAETKAWGQFLSPEPEIPSHGDNTPLAVENLLSTLFLRTADFRVVALTRTGTTLFTIENNSLWCVLDGSSLETGLIHVVTFKPNGEVHHITQRRPFNLTQIMIFHVGNGWPMPVLIENNVGGRPWHNKPMDLDLPVLDLLQMVKDRGKFQYTDWGSREMWAREIERAAPGDLQLEAEGREGEFMLESLAQLE